MEYCTVAVPDIFFWDPQGCFQAKTHFQFTQFSLLRATKEGTYGLIMTRTFADGRISVHMLPHMYSTEAHFSRPPRPR